MNRGMVPWRLVLLPMVSLPCAAVTPDREPFEHCVVIESAAARLACYDAAAGRAAERSIQVPDSAAKTPSEAPAPVEAGAAAGDFGLTPAQRKLEPTGPDAEQAVINSVADDRVGHAIVALDNGQTWFVAEPDGRLRAGQVVTIRRAALGSFTMTTDDRHGYKVRRTR